MKDTRQCDCVRPWPKMLRLGVGSLDRYYLCRRCGCIRHETAPGPGLIDDIHFFDLKDPRLPEAVWREAHRVLSRPVYCQLELFDCER